MDNLLKPRIRFKGFTDVWEQRKLDDYILDLKSGLSRMLSDNDIGLPVVRANNIYDCKLDLNHEVKYWYINDPQGADTSNYFIQKNDLLINFINSEAKMGTAAIVENKPKRDTIYTTNILRMRLNDKGNPNFYLAQTLTKKYKDYIKGISKIAVNQASFTTVDFKNYQLTAPNILEQEKIGLLFSNIDNLITLHQRKCDKLVELKKSLLEKMFPKNSSNIPEIRFKGFTDVWEQRKFEKIFNYERPDKYIVESTEYLEFGPTPVLTANKAFILGYTNEKNLYLNSKNSIIFDDFTLDAKFVDFPYMVKSSAIKILTVKDEKTDNLRFNYYLLSQHKFNMLGHARHYISVVQPEEVYTTNKVEQNKIGELFTNIDNLITLHQRKQQKLINLKQSLLNDMFI